ncbi:MAG: tetratricopeptide repeat protein [Haliscomenobacter sp.]|nr:tetratricopeptide repeat protein [Haliscomenobacter sp.]
MTELRYIFRHALLREAAYSMQLRATLQHLHRLIAEALERLYRDQLEDRYFDLAFLMNRGRVSEKTVFYLEKAGDFARSRFLNQQALEYYDKLLRLAEVQSNPAQKSQILLKKAKILDLIGNWDACALALKEAISNSRKTQLTDLLGQAANAYGRLLMLQGDYPQAMRQLQESIQIFDQLGDKGGRTEALGNLGNLYFPPGKYPEAEQYFHQSIEIARQLEGGFISMPKSWPTWA